MTGQVQSMFAVLPSALPYIRSGQVRVLGVAAAQRQEVLPGIPAISEFLPGYEAQGWYGIAAAKDTPGEIVGKLNNAINSGLSNSKSRQRLVDLGCGVFSGTPADFTQFIAGETAKWTRVVRTAGIRAD